MSGVFSKRRQDASEVRISTELSDGEKESRSQRNETVRKAIEKLTGKHVHKGREPPIIAVLGSGGGMRAAIAMLGTLQALAESDLLDCVSYVSGVSGSTWSMSQLFNQRNWSKDMKNMVDSLKSQFTERDRPFSEAIDHLKKTGTEPAYSLTNFWGVSLVYHSLGKIDTSKLSDHRGAVSNGMNPYPIYAAVHEDRIRHSHTADAWFEFTPHEAGFPSPGAFVSVEKFNAVFEAGKEIGEKNKERDLNYLQGLWGSALADRKAIVEWILEHLKKLLWSPPDAGFEVTTLEARFTFQAGKETGEKNEERDLNYLQGLENNRCKHCYRKLMKLMEKLETLNDDENFEAALSKLALELQAVDEKDYCECSSEKIPDDLETLNESMAFVAQKRISLGPSVANLKLYLAIFSKTIAAVQFWNWGKNSNFAYQDARLKERSQRSQELYENEYIHLIDAGLENNCSYPLVLRKERKVDLILSFDFSAGDAFVTLTEAKAYCTTNNIPFPDLPQDLERPKQDVYVLTENGAISVMHFPLFNDLNCKEGESPETMMAKYGTMKLSYSGEEFDELLSTASQNVSNNVGKIIEQIKALL